MKLDEILIIPEGYSVMPPGYTVYVRGLSRYPIYDDTGALIEICQPTSKEMATRGCWLHWRLKNEIG